MTAPADPSLDARIATLIARARGTSRAPGSVKLRRIVVRFAGEDVARVDEVRKHFRKASRSQLLRAFLVAGLLMAEEYVKARTPAPVEPPAPPEGGAP